jgi:multicomponent Na+:H+ antiporter subunit G
MTIAWVETAGQVTVAAGALLLVVAAAGLQVLPDALSRQHAGTKAVTFALGLLCAGAALIAQDAGWTARLAALLLILGTTLPVASHMLARAAVREQGLQEQAERAPVLQSPAVPSTEAGPTSGTGA